MLLFRIILTTIIVIVFCQSAFTYQRGILAIGGAAVFVIQSERDEPLSLNIQIEQYYYLNQYIAFGVNLGYARYRHSGWIWASLGGETVNLYGYTALGMRNDLLYGINARTGFRKGDAYPFISASLKRITTWFVGEDFNELQLDFKIGSDFILKDRIGITPYVKYVIGEGANPDMLRNPTDTYIKTGLAVTVYIDTRKKM
jgi:hypothetical protein